MYLGFVAGFVTAWLSGAFEVIFESNSEPWGVLLAATIIFVVGVLDDEGSSESSRLLLPPDPALVGLSFFTAFVVLDLGATCPVETISESYGITIEAGAIPFGSFASPGETGVAERVARRGPG